jgi:hypothetical protein
VTLKASKNSRLAVDQGEAAMKRRGALAMVACLLLWLVRGGVGHQAYGEHPPPAAVDPSKRPTFVSPESQRQYHKSVFEGDYGLPVHDEISEIQAELYQCISRKPDVAPFLVPRASYPAILKSFEKGIIQRDPIFSMPEIGTLRIRTKDGSIRRICIYGGAHSPLMFSIHGVRCVVDRKATDFRDESIVFEDLVRDAHAAANGLP